MQLSLRGWPLGSMGNTSWAWWFQVFSFLFLEMGGAHEWDGGSERNWKRV